ncbi:MAG: benzoate-CoA ligase family protein, partial [Planctomycetes bacterium]|nr:benzoate-CoA ligase family protein [Planctomycetota bacterium]
DLPERFNLCEYYLDHNLAAGRGDKCAIVDEVGSWTYDQVFDQVQRMAVVLREMGVRPEDRVLIVLPDALPFVTAFFGVLRVGGVFAMVNPLLKAKDYAAYLQYTKARVVITHQSVMGEMAKAAQEVDFPGDFLVVDGDGTLGAANFAEALAAADPNSLAAALEPTGPDDLAGWLFTSGSTGRPKACVHMHRDFAYSTETYALQIVGYREDDVCVGVPKLFFGYATGTNLMFPFRVGATCVLFEGRSTADELLNQIEAHRPTIMTGVPTLLNNMLNSDRVDRVDLSCLRLCLSAGEALPEQVYTAWKERTGVEVLDGIGSAEMFHIYISNRPGDVKLGSLGKLVPGYWAEILGPDGEVLGVGESGRLRIYGGSTAMCYWANKNSSQETFQAEACTTADIFREDEEGYFYYEGRADDLLKVSGIWVSPLEIENCLLGHAGVAQVCIVGKEDESGMVKPLAFVVPSEGHTGGDALADELKAHIKERLAPYKYPRWFEWREDLPKNDRGKVARAILRSEMETQPN